MKLTPHQQAAERCKAIVAAVESLEGPEPVGESLAAIRAHRVRNRGRLHVAAMASLKEPTLPEPSPLDVEARAAWRNQLRHRAFGRAYLADLALAGDLMKEPSWR
ncbi:hypothetical protein [Roseateles sp. LYH14W]|uniref:Uncharacterized protein n=1 Tax=Pelomonas parva TaxID=3299032 RepID=A0ABW7EZE7_9BURK